MSSNRSSFSSGTIRSLVFFGAMVTFSVIAIYAQEYIGLQRTTEWLRVLGYLFALPSAVIIFLISYLGRLCDIDSLSPRELERLREIVDLKIRGLWLAFLYCVLFGVLAVSAPTVLAVSPDLGAFIATSGTLGTGGMAYIISGIVLIERETRHFYWELQHSNRERERREQYLEKRFKDEVTKDSFQDLDPSKHLRDE